MNIGKLINSYRRIKDISIRDMAAKIDISPSTLSRIENGEDVDGRVMLNLIAYCFGVDDDR